MRLASLQPFNVSKASTQKLVDYFWQRIGHVTSEESQTLPNKSSTRPIPEKQIEAMLPGGTPKGLLHCMIVLY